MTLRKIKKLAQQKRLSTPKLQRLFIKVLPHSKSIRNTCYRGMIRMGQHKNYLKYAMKYGDINVSINWEHVN